MLPVTVVFEDEVSRSIGVVSVDDGHHEFFASRHVRDGFSFAVPTSAQRQTVSGLLEHGVRVAGVPLGGTTSGRQQVREVDEGDVESLAWQRLEPPWSHVRPTSSL